MSEAVVSLDSGLSQITDMIERKQSDSQTKIRKEIAEFSLNISAKVLKLEQGLKSALQQNKSYMERMKETQSQHIQNELEVINQQFMSKLHNQTSIESNSLVVKDELFEKLQSLQQQLDLKSNIEDVCALVEATTKDTRLMCD